MFVFNPPWNECIADGCLREGQEKVRPPPPQNPHPTSMTTSADWSEEVERRAKARAKCERKVAKAEKVESKNVELTEQDVTKKKGWAFASKASRSKKDGEPSSIAKPQRKTIMKRAKKDASNNAKYSSSSKEDVSEGILKIFSMTE